MGLIDAIKKKLKPEETGHQSERENHYEVDVPVMQLKQVEMALPSTTVNKPKSDLAVQPQNQPPTLFASNPVPLEVLDLLWFKDGPMKNLGDMDNQYIYKGEHFSIKVSFLGSIEPSAIGVSEMIRPSNDEASVERPPYYPSYERLSHEQRWIYLRWLRDVDKEINIGYVFIFYYGLERHLFFGKYEAAFDMILRLRRVHRNSSFLSYSTSALIATCIFHNRPDMFLKFLQSLNETRDEDVNALYLLAKRSLNIDLTPSELMLLANEVGFGNKRYLEGEAALFENELRRCIVKALGRETIDLRLFALNDTPTRLIIIAANFSLKEEQRVVQIPDLSQNKAFRELVHHLLQESHDAVKEQIKQRRKEEKANPTTNESEPEATTPCPYCNNQVKMPQTKRVCPSCKNLVYARTDPETKTKVFVTEEGMAKLETRKKELQVINCGIRHLRMFGIDKATIERRYMEMRSKGASYMYYDAIWSLANEKLVEYANDLQKLKMLYFGMAWLKESEGGDPAPFIRASADTELKIYQRHQVARYSSPMKVKILCAAGCDGCKAYANRTFTIEEALKLHPIPISGCTYRTQEDHYPFCRCMYNIFVE